MSASLNPEPLPWARVIVQLLKVEVDYIDSGSWRVVRSNEASSDGCRALPQVCAVSPEEAGQVAWDHVATPAATVGASGAPGQSPAGGGAAMNRTPGNWRKWAS